MKTSSKVNIAIAVFVVIVLGVAWAVLANVAGQGSSPTAGPPDSPGSSLPGVANDERRLLEFAADGKVTFVEYLDFECAVCGVAYPVIEELRDEYAGKVTFVVRYFPIPSHPNSMTAAVAVEAAARQDRFVDMYEKVFETQDDWENQQQSQAPRFREYAADIGLDLTAYDAAVADPATQARVQADFDGGLAIGVTGTPTFFVNDVRIDAARPSDLRAALDAALAAG